MFDYSKLKGRIKEVLGSNNKYAELLNLSEASISAKLNSKVPFSILEIDKSLEILNIPRDEIPHYFFVKKTEKNSIND